jgi:hypothetical protein
MSTDAGDPSMGAANLSLRMEEFRS